MILFIDNYDSFTYNLVQAVGALDANREIRVVRNDEASVDELVETNPTHVIISPGPCTPNEAGISMEVARRFTGRVPILGVCLGHQAIAQAFGARIERAGRLMHGKVSEIYHDGKGIYAGLPNPFPATRYHSLIVDRGTLPAQFEITARTDREEMMGFRHRQHAVEAVQFHPESFLTEQGPKLIANFLQMKEAQPIAG
jgi:anthranilate synthase component 2/para-aminobenzoate synthetase component 2